MSFGMGITPNFFLMSELFVPMFVVLLQPMGGYVCHIDSEDGKIIIL